MNRKLLFFDLDGTLLSNVNAEITPSAVEAMKKAQANGHLCFVNTGRPIGSVGPNVRAFPFDGYICGCGTHIFYKGQEMQHVVVDPEVVCELIAWNQKENIDIFLEGEGGLLFPPEATFKDLEEMDRFFTSQGAKVAYYNYDMKRPEDVNFPVDKFCMWRDPEDPLTEYRAFLEEHFMVIERNPGFWEVIPKGYTKATGIDDIVRYAGADLSDTISFGDSYNDILMLEHTKEAVLMGNGYPELADMVTYVTTDIDEDGIANALKHFELI